MKKNIYKALLLTAFALLTLKSYATPLVLEVKYEKIVINKRIAKVIKITQVDGTWGYTGTQGTDFDVVVQNRLNESTVLHWHGLILPNDQDGTELTQDYIPAGGSYHYHYPLTQAGTYFMHSHFELQEQFLASAPFIIYPQNYNNGNDVVIMLQDFSFTPAKQILAKLTGVKNPTPHSMKAQSDKASNMQDMPGMDMSDMGDMSGHDMQHGAMDLNDVKYDAFLTNLHTPQDPEIRHVKAGAKMRLRFINGAASSNFWINLGKLQGTLIAVDGNNIKPITGNKFQISIGQRLDIEINIPKSGGNFPILAQVEGLKNQTGMILSTNKTAGTIAPLAAKAAPALNYAQELRLSSANAESTPVISKAIDVVINGNMAKYSWTINNQTWPNITPIELDYGKTYQLNFINKSMMSHPMHLHGYVFHIVEVNGKKIDGALQDTVLVQPNSTVKVVVTADHKGKWLLHCHNMYHMPTGMMTYIEVK